MFRGNVLNIPMPYVDASRIVGVRVAPTTHEGEVVRYVPSRVQVRKGGRHSGVFGNPSPDGIG